MKRGPRSAAELSTPVALTVLDRSPPKPPAELTDAQAEIWRNAVAAMPTHDWTRGTLPVLVSYCRHVCRARLLEQQIATFEVEWVNVKGGLERLNKLLTMAERETRALIAAARALRLTPASRMHPRTAGRRLNDEPTGNRPWDGYDCD